jgi:hypothetical protein
MQASVMNGAGWRRNEFKVKNRGRHRRLAVVFVATKRAIFDRAAITG